MASERLRRENAGSRMGKLLEAEDEDEFYKTTYGGFDEEADDNDYKSEESDSESTDSDFSIDENEEVHSDANDDDEPKRKKRVVTKAYKEPKRESVPEIKKTEVKKEKKKQEISSVQIYQSPERKSLRKSTALKSQATQSRQKIREEQARILRDIADRKNVTVEDVRRLTQEELLAEAKITEQINLKSLETYQKLELEKKRTRVQKQVYRGPIIRYHSVTMPLLSDDACLEPEIDVDEDSENQRTPNVSQPVLPTEVCSRTFITFTDDKVFQEVFPQTKKKPPQKLTCPVTRLPAKYFDPVTMTPYATAQAFKFIREAYAKQLAQQKEEQNSIGPAAASQQRKKERLSASSVAHE